LLFTPFDPASWSAVSIASVFALGLGPTALAGIIIIMIIRRAGASFMALGNYVVPAVAVILGALIFHERLEPPVFLALAVILAGVAVSQSRKRPVIETGDALAADIAPIVERSDPVQKSS